MLLPIFKFPIKWFRSLSKPKSNLTKLEIMAQVFKTRKLVDEYKTIFPGERRKRWNSSKTFSLYWSFLQSRFEACQKPKSNLIRLEIMTQSFKMRKLVDEYKTIFLGKQGTRGNSSKTFSVYLSFL